MRYKADFKGWKQRADDIPWQKQLLAFLKTRVPDDYYRKVAKDIGKARVRPEEVAGACLEEIVPTGFAQCEPNGKYIVSEIEKQSGKKKKW